MIKWVSEWINEWKHQFFPKKWTLYQLHKEVFLSRHTYKNKSTRTHTEISYVLIRLWPNVCGHPNTKAICARWTFNFKSISINMELVFPISFDSSGKLSTRCCSIAVGIYSHSDMRASVKSGTHAGRWGLAHNHCSNSSQRLNGVQADSNF